MKIERRSREDHKSYEFPLNKSEIEGILEKLPSKHIEGLKKIIVTYPPKNADYKNYGRYVPDGTIYLFRHYKKGDKFVIDLSCGKHKEHTPEEFKNNAYGTVLHEVGHHVSMYHEGIMDIEESEKFANRYQDKNLRKYFPDMIK